MSNWPKWAEDDLARRDRLRPEPERAALEPDPVAIAADLRAGIFAAENRAVAAGQAFAQWIMRDPEAIEEDADDIIQDLLNAADALVQLQPRNPRGRPTRRQRLINAVRAIGNTPQDEDADFDTLYDRVKELAP